MEKLRNKKTADIDLALTAEATAFVMGAFSIGGERKGGIEDAGGEERRDRRGRRGRDREG
eukprot:5072066-Pyramimonas_sp.AAC.1